MFARYVQHFAPRGSGLGLGHCNDCKNAQTGQSNAKDYHGGFLHLFYRVRALGLGRSLSGGALAFYSTESERL